MHRSQVVLPFRNVKWVLTAGLAIAAAPALRPAAAISEGYGTLHVCKNVQWGDWPRDENVSFELCIVGPLDGDTGPGAPQCATFGPNGGSHQFEGLIPGEYQVYEADPGPQWIATHWEEVCPPKPNPPTPHAEQPGPSINVQVWSDETTCATIRNTYTGPTTGSITIIKTTEPAGGTGFSFEVLRPSIESITSETLAVFVLDDGGSKTVENLMPGTYRVREIVPADWNLDTANIVCSGSFEPRADGAEVYLGSGENVVCTFTNECAVEDPPVITCPANMEIPAGGTFDLNALAPATAVGNCGFPVETSAEITSDVAGECPIARVVTVTWTAADGEGRTSTCQQTVRISGADSDGDGTVDCLEDNGDTDPGPDDNGDSDRGPDDNGNDGNDDGNDDDGGDNDGGDNGDSGDDGSGDDGGDSGQEAPLLEEVVKTTTFWGLPCCGAGAAPLGLTALALAAFMTSAGRRRFR